MNEHCALYGEYTGVRTARKHLGWYVRHMPGGEAFRQHINTLEDPQAQAPLEAQWAKLPGLVEHTFTHFHLELAVWRAEAIADGVLRDDGDYRWTTPEDIDGEALPTVMRKVVAHVLRPLAPSPRRKRK